MKVTFWLISLPALIALSLKGGIYLYAHFSRTHNLLTRLYLLTLFGFSIQNIAEVAHFHTLIERGAMPHFEVNIFYAAAIAAYAFLFHLVLALVFDTKNKTVGQFVAAIYLYAVALEALLFFTPWLIVGYAPIRQYTVTRIPGPLYWVFEMYGIGICLSTIGILAHGIKRQLSPYKRSQIKLVLVAIVPMNLVLMVVLVALHTGVRLFNASVTMPVALTFFLVLTAYATHQYRLFDIEFFLPWSKVRKRKTLFYRRIQAVIAEIAQLPSAQKALQAVSDLFHCQVALVGGGRSFVAVPASVGFTNATIDHFNADTFPREALDNIDRIVVAHEIAERDSVLHQLMRHHGVGAVVPFDLPRAVGHQWLVLGDQFSEQVYTPLDFQQVEALFARIADCFLDDFLSLRSSFATAIQRNDAEWQKRVQQTQQELRESERTVTRLESEIHRLREEIPRAQWRSQKALEIMPPRLGEKTRNGYVYTAGHSRICGTGIYLPEERITTQDLLREIDSKNRFGVPYHWLERVTGIREKRVTPPGVLPSDMAVTAAKEALERAKILPDQVNVIIYTGLTRDYLEPATAHVVQAKLGATNAMVFDICNACHGFMNGIHTIDALIATGQITYGLVVTGEQGNLFAHKAVEILKKTTDRDQFTALAVNLTGGDAGAAIVLGPKKAPDSGFVGIMLQSQGQHARLCAGGGPLTGGPLLSDMPTQLREGAKLTKEMFQELMCQRLKWEVSELAKCFIHQIGTKGLFRVHHDLLGIPFEIMPNTVDVFGNLATANIPLNLHYCILNHELKAGGKIYLSGSGSGLSISQAGLIWDALD